MRKIGWAGIAGAVVLTLTASVAVHADEMAGRLVGVGDVSALEAALRAHGWSVERNAEGELIVHPPESAPGRLEPGVRTLDADSGQATATPVPFEEFVSDPQDAGLAPDRDVVAADDLDALKVLAEDRGWGVHRERDGSLLLYPPGTPISAADGQVCQIGMTRITDATGQPLPAVTEEQVRALAEVWLREHGSTSLAVGRIRQVNRLHLASIVSAQPPHSLHAQLVVHVGDGCLISIPR